MLPRIFLILLLIQCQAGRGNPGRGGHVYLAQATDLSLSVYKIYDNEKQALNDSKILNFLFQEKESGQPLIMDSFKIPRTRTDNESWGPRVLQLQYIKGQTVQSILRDTTGRYSEGYKKIVAAKYLKQANKYIEYLNQNFDAGIRFLTSAEQLRIDVSIYGNSVLKYFKISIKPDNVIVEDSSSDLYLIDPY